MPVFVILVGFLLSAGYVFAQNPPALTEVEQLKIQIANLQIQLRNEQTNAAKWLTSYGTCQTQLLENTQPLAQMLTTLESEIEKNHIGYDFDLKTGEFKPKAAPPASPK
jgi:hypothetical protein